MCVKYLYIYTHTYTCVYTYIYILYIYGSFIHPIIQCGAHELYNYNHQFVQRCSRRLHPHHPEILQKKNRIPLKNGRVHTIGCVQELDLLGGSIVMVDPKNKLDDLFHGKSDLEMDDDFFLTPI